MADPVLSMPELLEGDPLGYLRQNNINMVLARLGVDPRITNNTLTTPPTTPGSVGRSQAWILSGAGTGNWAGKAAGTIAIALSTDPVSAAGWYFYTPWTGMEVYLLAGSPTGWVQWNGTAWVARP